MTNNEQDEEIWTEAIREEGVKNEDFKEGLLDEMKLRRIKRDVVFKKIRKATDLIKQQHPYYYAITDNYKVHTDSILSTFTITYPDSNSFTHLIDYFAHKSIDEIAALILYDIHKVVSDYKGRSARIPEEDKGLFDLAMDLEVGQMVLETPILKFMATPALFGFPDGLCAEKYYVLLKEKFGQNKEAKMAKKEDVELFDPKFVHFMWDESLESKEGFVADNIDDLIDKVENNREKDSCHRDGLRHKTIADQYGTYWAFFYYDPNYEVKWAYFIEDKTVQYQDCDKKWVDISDAVISPKYFDDDHTYQIKPEEKSKKNPQQIDIKAENMEVTININGQDIKFKSVEEARLFLNTDK